MSFLQAVDQSVDPLVRGLDLRRSRHAAVSANIANAETPGYNARDVSFGRILERARLALTQTHSRHLQSRPRSEADRMIRSGGEPRRDGNDVDIDREMVKLARNQIEYRFLTRILGGRFRKLKEAITGRATS